MLLPKESGLIKEHPHKDNIPMDPEQKMMKRYMSHVHKQTRKIQKEIMSKMKIQQKEYNHSIGKAMKYGHKIGK